MHFFKVATLEYLWSAVFRPETHGMRSRSSSPPLLFPSYRMTPILSLSSFPVPTRPPGPFSSSSKSSNTSAGNTCRSYKPNADGPTLYMPPSNIKKPTWNPRDNRMASPFGQRSKSTPAEQFAIDDSTGERERCWPILYANALVPPLFPLVTLRHVKSPPFDHHLPSREGEHL